MSKSFGVVVLVTAALVPGVAQGATVYLFDPSPYSQDGRASVIFSADNGEANNLTVSLDGSAVIVNDPGVTITSGSTRCEISNDGHAAICTPKPEHCTVESQEPGQPPVLVCTPVDPSQVPVPTVVVDLLDLNDTLVNNAAIPSEEGGFFSEFRAYGRSGNDNLTGSSTGDHLSGGLGSDTARGLGGDDYLVNPDPIDFAPEIQPDDDGNDDFFGGEGADYLVGGTGNNVLDGGPGADALEYQIPPVFDQNQNPVPPQATDPGALIVLNAAAPTTGNGLSGQNDTIIGIEDVFGTQGADNITGSSEVNFLNGLGGNDSIVGGGGFDGLFGNSGADAIDSRDAGVDRVNCGSQADDTATVDDVDQVSSCPEVGAGLTVIDTTPPETTLDEVKVNKRKRFVRLSFSGSDTAGAVSFECKLDRRDFAPCQSPYTYRRLKAGRHTVSVRAKDATGNVHPTPATRRFKI